MMPGFFVNLWIHLMNPCVKCVDYNARWWAVISNTSCTRWRKSENEMYMELPKGSQWVIQVFVERVRSLTRPWRRGRKERKAAGRQWVNKHALCVPSSYLERMKLSWVQIRESKFNSQKESWDWTTVSCKRKARFKVWKTEVWEPTTSDTWPWITSQHLSFLFCKMRAIVIPNSFVGIWEN